MKEIKQLTLIIFTLCILTIQNTTAQTETTQSSVTDIMNYEIGYVHLGEFQVGGFHLGMNSIQNNSNFGFGVNSDIFFSTSDLTLGIIDVNANYYIVNQSTFKIFPYLGLSLGIISGNDTSPDNPMDIKATEFGLDTGVTGLIFINSFSISATYGYNSVVNVPLYRFSVGYNF